MCHRGVGGRCPIGMGSPLGFLSPGSVWSPDPAPVNSGAGSRAGESCVSSACSPGNGTEMEKEAPAAKGGLGTA